LSEGGNAKKGKKLKKSPKRGLREWYRTNEKVESGRRDKKDSSVGKKKKHIVGTKGRRENIGAQGLQVHWEDRSKRELTRKAGNCQPI